MSFAYWDAEAKRSFGTLTDEERSVIKSRLRKICLHYRYFSKPPDGEAVVTTPNARKITLAVESEFVTVTFQCDAGIPVFVSWKSHHS